MKHLILWALLSPFMVHAAYKCTVNGKVTYSDVVCAVPSSQTRVDTSENSLDTSGLRDQAAKDKALADAQAARDRAAAARIERFGKPDPCDGIISLEHKPSQRQQSEFLRCQDQKMREYNRPSN